MDYYAGSGFLPAMPTLAAPVLLSLLLRHIQVVLSRLSSRRTLLGAVSTRSSSIHIRCQALLTLISVCDGAFLWNEILGSALTRNLKAKQGRFEVVHSRRQNYVLVVLLEEHVGQGGTKVGPIKSISAHRDVHLFALGAIDLDSILTKLVAKCIRHYALLVTKSARAVPISTLQVLAVDQSEA